jgi:hypothetical protein
MKSKSISFNEQGQEVMNGDIKYIYKHFLNDTHQKGTDKLLHDSQTHDDV